MTLPLLCFGFQKIYAYSTAMSTIIVNMEFDWANTYIYGCIQFNNSRFHVQGDIM